MTDALDIWVHARRVGRLEAVASSRSFIFGYHENACPEDFISLSMPVEERLFEDRMLFPIFQQNLPEGELRALLGTRFSKTLTLIDDFDFLAVCGPYWRGRVRLSEMDGEPKAFGRPLLLDELLMQDSNELFEELIGKYGFATATRSGVQPKLALQVEDHRKIKPAYRTTLWTDDKIVKFENDDTDYPGIAIDEFLCMTAAREAGIAVPGFAISDDARRLIIDRFDETESGIALGFEEAATLMLFHAVEKYASSYERMCRVLLEEISESHREAARISLAKQLLLMVFIGNGDAHLKNFGVIYSGRSDVRLAPAYDIVCTTIYLKKDLPALGFEGRKTWFTGDALVSRVAKAAGLSEDAVLAYVGQIEEGIQRAIQLGEIRFRGQPKQASLVTALSEHWEIRRQQQSRG
ncbi:HipA [mine drainage metagenome]|uniref:HipA n=2 Tax=mine drainage metagenome TaxID=410659 RepID=T1BK83_9ZZZZ